MHPLFELTKPRLTSLVLATTWLGYALGARRSDPVLALATLAGTWLVASGAAALNQYLEIALDARMRRTRNRPLPSRRVTPQTALAFGLAISGAGAVILFAAVNALTAWLALLTWVTYLWAYTPLKTRTSLSTLVGAIPGAIPPMMGWTAARGEINPEAWVLFGILFLWQLPHFLAIAWMYREDYAQAGMPMLPVLDPDGGMTARMILLYTAVLVPVTLIPAGIGMAGLHYGIAALVLGAGFFACGAFVAWERSALSARRLMLVSVIYLPLLLGFLVWS